MLRDFQFIIQADVERTAIVPPLNVTTLRTENENSEKPRRNQGCEGRFLLVSTESVRYGVRQCFYLELFHPNTILANRYFHLLWPPDLGNLSLYFRFGIISRNC